MNDRTETLLDAIDSPADLRAMKAAELPQVAAAVRESLINIISRTGGHLAAGLGTVELAAALHYAFNTPPDRPTRNTGA